MKHSDREITPFAIGVAIILGSAMALGFVMAAVLLFE